MIGKFLHISKKTSVWIYTMLTIVLIGFFLLVIIYIYHRKIIQYLLLNNAFFADIPKQELSQLLGSDGNKKYLIALMNTSEKKPDGGFFGSYAILDIDKTGWNISLFDSYYPGNILPYRTPLPDRHKNILGLSDIGFLGANVIGFTPFDGQNIIDIYEQTFGEELNAVFFVKSDLFHNLLKDFHLLQRQREFENASIDLIRGEKAPNKKELYLKHLYGFIGSKNFWIMLHDFWKNTNTLLEKGYIRAYFPYASRELVNRLESNNLSIEYTDTRIFLYDYNQGFNKIDKFVNKISTIVNEAGDIILVANDDIIDIPDTIQSGLYTLYVQYTLDIPQAYGEYIDQLAKEYNITLTQRERVILMIEPQVATIGLIYLPQNWDIITVTGDIITQEIFTTPFSNNIKYEIAGQGDTLQYLIQTTIDIK